MQPFIPSLGLSDMIHLGVIIWHKTFGRFISKKLRKKTKIKNLKGLLSAITVCVVAFIICSSAITIVYVSATEEHSSYNLVRNYFKKDSVHSINSIALAEDKPMINCFEKSQGSLVDYLSIIDENYSFENREKIAESVGISPYNGTLGQNQAVLWRLTHDDSDQPKLSLDGSCKDFKGVMVSNKLK
jgi:hypothetical protein